MSIRHWVSAITLVIRPWPLNSAYWSVPHRIRHGLERMVGRSDTCGTTDPCSHIFERYNWAVILPAVRSLLHFIAQLSALAQIYICNPGNFGGYSLDERLHTELEMVCS